MSKKKRASKMPPGFDRLLGKLLSTPPVAAEELRVGKKAKSALKQGRQGARK
jgi:hypothetical protein